MAFSCIHLETISSKVNVKVHAKLQDIKCRMHKIKNTDANTAVITQVATTNAANTKITNTESEVMVKPKLIMEEQSTASQPSHAAMDGEDTNTKSADIQSADIQSETTFQHKLIAREQLASVELNHATTDGEKASSPISSHTSQKQKKKAERDARREARKAKWTAWRAAFKTKAKKVLDASLLSATGVLVIVIAPALIAFSIVILVLEAVGWVVIQVLDCMCAPVMLCFYLWE